MIGGGEFSSFLGQASIDQKLIVRSAQVHALMPMMQFSVAPWRILDSTHLNAAEKAVQLRQKNISSIMEVLRSAAQSGEPALRSLEYEFPNQGFVDTKDQFMMGSKLMVAPVVTASDVRHVVFPKGNWQYKNQIIRGPVQKSFNVPLDDLLYFIRLDK